MNEVNIDYEINKNDTGHSPRTDVFDIDEEVSEMFILDPFHIVALESGVSQTSLFTVISSTHT
jgi:hypothetical protein